MRILRNVFTWMVVFMFGVEIGGFTMWYSTMTVLRENKNNRHREHSYRTND